MAVAADHAVFAEVNMSAINAFFDFIGAWFGFVGSCFVSPTGACVPFLAFLALGVAAGAALMLLMLAYRSARDGARGETRAPGETRGVPALGERPGMRPRVNETPAAA
jgi:hypothetical protein